MGERPREGFSQESVAAVFPGARVDPKSIAATAMRGDFDASILSGYRNRVGGKDRIQLEIVIATYNGFTVTQVTTKLGIAQGTVTRVLNRFNDRGIDWLLGLLKRNGRPSTLDQSELYKVALREDWDAQAVRNAMSRAVDERHRAELEVVHQLYEQSGNAEIVGKLMKMPAAAVDQIGTAFNLHGETLGVEGRSTGMLPSEHDSPELPQSNHPLEHFQTKLQIVQALYDGVSATDIKRLDLKGGELETIVDPSEIEVVGLADDPLAGQHDPSPLKPKAAQSRPPTNKGKKRRQRMPRRPSTAMSRKASAEQLSLPTLPNSHPHRATLAHRLMSYLSVATHPHDRALLAVFLILEGGAVTYAANHLDMATSEVESWMSLYHRRGVKAFLSADRLSLHPKQPRDKSSAVRAIARQTEDEVHERRLLIVADSIDGDDMVSICERHEVAYDEAEACIAAYSLHGLAGLARRPVDVPPTTPPETTTTIGDEAGTALASDD
jgi:transposase